MQDTIEEYKGELSFLNKSDYFLGYSKMTVFCNCEKSRVLTDPVKLCGNRQFHIFDVSFQNVEHTLGKVNNPSRNLKNTLSE